MKKFLVAILTLLYISSSSGATVYMHYCMGKLTGAGLGNHTSKTCDKCGMEKAKQKGKHCCKDDNKFFKDLTDQDATVSVYNLLQPVAVALPVSYLEVPSVNILSIATENPISHSPPESSGVKVYIRNCVYRL